MGGLKCHWNDVWHDLVKCGLEVNWHELAQDRSAWRGVVKTCVDIINEEAEHKEDRTEDGRKSTKQSCLTAIVSNPDPNLRVTTIGDAEVRVWVRDYLTAAMAWLLL